MSVCLLLLVLVVSLLVPAPASAVRLAQTPAVMVGGLSMDGRQDNPLGVDDLSPVLSWQLSAGQQTAYQVRAASDAARLGTPDLWDSGKVLSNQSIQVPWGGVQLTSRQHVVWQVRVWDERDQASEWSAPSSWEMGLLDARDWGAARWIEYPGWAETQPLPIFARAFTPAGGKTVSKARLYISSVGPFVASVNGNPVTDDVLAPGYVNLQLEAEYHTYDVTSLLTSGSNTLGVQVGNGMELRSRLGTNATTGRTSPYAYNVSTATGSGTLTSAAAAGDTSVRPSSTANFSVGRTINVDTGNGGDNLESRTITGVFPAANTTLLVPAAPGDTNVKVAGVSNFGIGTTLNIDTGANLETVTTTAVGTAGSSTTLVGASTTLATTSATLVGPTTAGATTVQVSNNTGFTAGMTIGIDTGANAETAAVASTQTTGLPVPVYTVIPNPPVANWIWSTATGTSSAIGPAYLRKNFTVADPALVTFAPLRINGDDSAWVYVNGTSLGQTNTTGSNAWRTSMLVDIKPLLVPGNNVIALQVINPSSSGSAIGALEIYTAGDMTRYVTDTSWKALAGNPATGPAGWTTQSFDDSAWGNAFISAAYGGSPWGSTVTPIPSTSNYYITFAAPLANPHAASTLLGAITPAGVTNLKVASVTGFSAGQPILIDSGANSEMATVSAVGTAGAAGTGIDLTAPTTFAHTGAVAVASIAAPVGATNIKVASVTGFAAGGVMTVDTGASLETVTITAVGTAGVSGTGITFTPALVQSHGSGVAVTTPGTGISFTPALSLAHASGAAVAQLGAITFSPALNLAHASGAAITGSGINLTDTTATAGARVTPRLIGRLEITYADGSVDTIVSDHSWQAAPGPSVTSMWYSGTDYDARREQPGWDAPGADLTATATRRDGSPTGWIAAGIAPAPNLATQLIWHQGPPVKIVKTFTPVSVSQPVAGTWVFDFGQNFAGWPELHLSPFEGAVPAGAIIKMLPAESLNSNGTVNQGSLGPGGSRGTSLFNAYITYGNPAGETWRPQFQYFGMQYLQVTGLPSGYTPTVNTITGLQLRGANEQDGSFTSSDARINRIHQMTLYSFMSNMMAQFTDCPGREKQSYPADYMFALDSIGANFDLAAYLRWQMVLMSSSQLVTTATIGNIALKNPTWDVGSTGTFGNDPNWGGTVLFAPAWMYTEYGDVEPLRDFYPQMKAYINYITNQTVLTGADAYINTANLGDWVSAEATNTNLIGTWAYYRMASIMAQAAAMTGHDDDVATFTTLAANIKAAFNSHYFNTTLHRYTASGNSGTSGATQVAQAVALDAGLVPDGERDNVLNALIELIYAYHPFGGGAHLSGGTVGLQSTIRVLVEAGRADVLWDVLKENTRPSYGFFLQPTTAHPNGFTTIPEQWDGGSSQNHMILAQIEEWFHTGLAGIRQAPDSIAYKNLLIQPKVVGNLTHVEGSYKTPYGTVSSAWTVDAGGLALDVTIPGNTAATVYVPGTNPAKVSESGRLASQSAGVTYVKTTADAVVYSVVPGVYHFNTHVQAPAVSNSGDITVQYSDPVPAVAVSANSALLWGSTLNATATGLPAGLALNVDTTSADGTLPGTRTWKVSGIVTDKPGTYPVSVTATDDLGTQALTTFTITVAPEDAEVTYTGDQLVFTPSGGSNANVVLRATLRDSSLLGAGDTWPGDIRNATVTFKEGSTVLCGPAAAVLLGAETTVGTYSCTKSLGLGVHTISIWAGNYYVGMAEGLVEVAQPDGSFITGAGFRQAGTSAGTYAATAGSREQFAFNVKYTKSGKNMQGHANVIFVSGGKTYQITSNAIDSLGTALQDASGKVCAGPPSATCFGVANFRSKANLLDISNPASPVTVAGNLSLQMTLTDKGEPGTNDSIGISLYNGNTLLFSSEWNGAKTVEGKLVGGNIVVH